MGFLDALRMLRSMQPPTKAQLLRLQNAAMMQPTIKIPGIPPSQLKPDPNSARSRIKNFSESPMQQIPLPKKRPR